MFAQAQFLSEEEQQIIHNESIRILEEVGALFGRTIRSVGKSELIILITPQIVDHNYIQIQQQPEIQKTNDVKDALDQEPRHPIKAFREILFPEIDGP
jgi:hypothetical protein